MTAWVIEKGGDRQTVRDENKAAWLADGWSVVTECPGLDCDDVPDEAIWHDATSAWVVNDLKRADQEASPEAILRAHAIKQVEAAMIASGVTLTAGLLFEESAALSIDIEDLAATVLLRAAPQRAAEISRRERKEDFRAAYPDLVPIDDPEFAPGEGL